MITTQKKTATKLGSRAVSKKHFGFHSISLSAWALSYRLEESRLDHERHGRHFRRLVCCAGLALIQLAGGRHV